MSKSGPQGAFSDLEIAIYVVIKYHGISILALSRICLPMDVTSSVLYMTLESQKAYHGIATRCESELLRVSLHKWGEGSGVSTSLYDIHKDKKTQ